MKHPALVRKLEGYRYETLYNRYVWRVSAVTFLILANFVLLSYSIWREQIPLVVLGVLLFAGVSISVGIGHHYGSRLAQRKQAKEKAASQENTAGGDKAA